MKLFLLVTSYLASAAFAGNLDSVNCNDLKDEYNAECECGSASDTLSLNGLCANGEAATCVGAVSQPTFTCQLQTYFALTSTTPYNMAQDFYDDGTLWDNGPSTLDQLWDSRECASARSTSDDTSEEVWSVWIFLFYDGRCPCGTVS